MVEIGSFSCRRLYTPAQCLEYAKVEISKGRIVAIHSGGKISPSDLNASHLNASPGLVDLHIQGCGGYDFLDGSPEAVRIIRYTALRGGCTSLLATTTFPDTSDAFARLSAIVQAIRAGRENGEGARIIGIHLEGPFLNPEKRGGFGINYIRKADMADFRQAMEIVGDDLRMMTISPEMEGALEILRECVAHGIRISLGHTTATYDLARKCFEMGANHVTHLFNAMNGLNHREPGLVGAALEDERVFTQVIPDGVHIHPAILRLIYRIKGAERLCLITDATAPCGLPDGSEIEGVGGRITIRDGAVRLPDGTLAGSALLMSEAVRRMHHLAGVSLNDALRMATLTPATAIRMEREIGSAERGCMADFILFDDELRIHYIILGGRVITVG
ncbi:MAG: N-acetylglucosamine-6-phosphate deacetylase [Candidatus Sumerlaeota bacterium]|nr:N-acetylglucosamine-6-phosphate deacetylase [Candidatus Sumerlaeota bacterium]